MELIVDEVHCGPTELAWNDRMSRLALPALRPIRERRVVIVAPHPDDEVLGAGGLIQRALRDKQIVEIIAVTDGEASHSNAPVQPKELAALRERESMLALQRLGWNRPSITRLHLPDGNVRGHLRELNEALADFLLPDDLCVAPWRSDGHPDHDATGEAAVRASRGVGARSLSYLVWAWHWADPEGADIPWAQSERLSLGRRSQARKRWSSLAFQTQIRPLGPTVAEAPILPAPLLRRFWRSYEIFVDDCGDNL